MAAGIQPGRCAVITNPTVAAHHLPALLSSLERGGFEPVVLTAPDGEAYKTLATVGDLYHGMAGAKLARNEAVVALGGGVIGDMAGFVAATYLRGVPFVQVPTSLLSMVDASVGGKVAVDLPEGKNLVGAFKQPELVLIDPDVLATLPGAEFRSGLGEVVKSGIIGNPLLFAQLLGDGPATLADMIASTVRVKADLVQRDPYETGDRMALNLGHTFGHALELVSGFSLRHGDAVAIGIVAAAALSERLALCEPGTVDRLREMLRRLGLPTSYPFDESAVFAAMGTDKKRRGRALAIHPDRTDRPGQGRRRRAGRGRTGGVTGSERREIGAHEEDTRPPRTQPEPPGHARARGLRVDHVGADRCDARSGSAGAWR